MHIFQMNVLNNKINNNKYANVSKLHEYCNKFDGKSLRYVQVRVGNPFVYPWIDVAWNLTPWCINSRLKSDVKPHLVSPVTKAPRQRHDSALMDFGELAWDTKMHLFVTSRAKGEGNLDFWM